MRKDSWRERRRVRGGEEEGGRKERLVKGREGEENGERNHNIHVPS